MNNQPKNYTNQLLENLKKRKTLSSFMENIWGAELADIQLICNNNKRIQFSLYVTGIFSKYTWVALLKDKKVILITNAFQKPFNESGGCKPKKYE